jgi:hypothetical protein
MRKILVLAGALVSIATLLQAQDSTATSGSSSNLKDKASLAAARDSIITVVKALLKSEKKEGVVTGTFRASNIGQQIPVYCYLCGKSGGKTKDEIGKLKEKDECYGKIGEVRLDSVELSIIEGAVREINVYTEHGKFTNGSAPISVPYYEDRLDDVLGYVGNTGKQQQQKSTLKVECSEMYIELNDVAVYTPRTGENYVPDDVRITLNSKQNSKTLILNPDINVLINAKLYTDLLGILGEEPNGLTQTELSTRIILNTKNLKNLGTTLFNYVRAFGTLSKFDGKYKATGIDGDIISRQDLMQRSWGRVALELNLVKTWISKKSGNYFGIDAGLSGQDTA